MALVAEEPEEAAKYGRGRAKSVVARRAGRLREEPVVSPSQEREETLGVRAGHLEHGPATTILLVEEYAAVRRGIRLLIEAQPHLAVLGGASTVREAVDGPWEPDVVVHGLLFPDGVGAQAVTALRARFPRAGLVALTRLDTPVYVHLALGAGDNGYVLKSASPAELVEAVRRVAHGEEWVQPGLGALLARWDEIPRRHNRGTLWDLTRREQEVLELLALGHTNAEVAQSLAVALRTVEAHRTHLMQKLGLRTRAEIVRFVGDQQRAHAGH
jgi:two-component system, NarL family, response regulator NreC